MSEIIETFGLGFPWTTLDPFLFCVHHVDAYPAGNEQMGPAASLAGRQLGMDFAGKDGWRMYHGSVVPGFPGHPHRGFETVTIARRGLIDHADSLGAAARFGGGDVQWLTAGRGIVHSEMFPLLDRAAGNPAELFQIWLNLPREDKLVDPHFSMLWAPSIPVHVARDAAGRATRVTVIAGALEGAAPPSPPPRSWAARPESAVAIWSIRMEPGARWTLPPAPRGVNRALYVFGGGLAIGERALAAGMGARLAPEAAVMLEASDAPAEALLLQGRPIGEPVAQQGPFVMTTPGELRQAFADYQRTRFGGWPWPSEAPVHPRDAGRFARHADGRVDSPTGLAEGATAEGATARAS
jgi:redox-sensitive bicupin YhaK (pirin superfamily)